MMPSLSRIMARTAAAFGLTSADVVGARTSEVAARARQVFAWCAIELNEVAPSRVGFSIGVPARTAQMFHESIRAERRADPELRLWLDRLAVEISAEALALARLKLLPVRPDPDPADTAARLLAGGADALTVSEDALRSLALAYLARAADSPSDPETHHG